MFPDGTWSALLGACPVPGHRHGESHSAFAFHGHSRGDAGEAWGLRPYRSTLYAFCAALDADRGLPGDVRWCISLKTRSGANPPEPRQSHGEPIPTTATSRDCYTSAGPAIRGTASGYTRRPRLARGVTCLEYAKSPGGVPEPCSGARTRWCSGDRFTNSDQLGSACGLAGLAAVSDLSMGRLFYRSPYYVVAALNLTTSSAGTRPRSFTSMPWALAHSRTSVAFSPVAEVLRPLRGGRRAPPLTRRAAPT